MDQECIEEIKHIRQYLLTNDISIIAINNGEIIGSMKGNGIKPFLELIKKYGPQLEGCVIGDRILGKASALLSRYIKAKAVYALQGTKKAIATLIVGGIVNQVDEIIEYVHNKTKNGICPFEQLLMQEDDPKKAYELLVQNIMISKDKY